MITIEGTVIAILGKPILRLIIDASIPATKAPIKAATAGGTFDQLTKLKRKVLATAPERPATVAIEILELNIIEKPKTPQKLAINLKRVKTSGAKFNFSKFCGCKFKIKAITQPTAVATTIIIIA